MRKKTTVSIIFLIVLLLTSCISTKVESEQIHLNKLLPDLDVEFEADLYDTEYNGYTLSETMKAIWKNDVKNNIVENRNEKEGTIKIQVIEVSRNTSYIGSAVSYLLGGIPSLFGADIRKSDLVLYFEVSITNKNNKEVWSNYYRTEFKAKENIYNVDSDTVIKEAIIDAFKEQLNFVKLDIEKNYDSIVRNLQI